MDKPLFLLAIGCCIVIIFSGSSVIDGKTGQKSPINSPSAFLSDSVPVSMESAKDSTLNKASNTKTQVEIWPQQVPVLANSDIAPTPAESLPDDYEDTSEELVISSDLQPEPLPETIVILPIHQIDPCNPCELSMMSGPIYCTDIAERYNLPLIMPCRQIL